MSQPVGPGYRMVDTWRRDHKMNLLKVDPKWKNLYGDPRFEDLVTRIGF